MKRSLALALVPVALLTACGSDNETASDNAPQYRSAAPALISAAGPTRDEDPSVLLARDGSIVVAWFSDRGGNPDIYVSRTTDGDHWADPVRVTVSADGDFYPNLIQDDNGMFHLTWFRWYAFERGHIWYNRTTDPLVWNTNTEVQVTTTADVDDWVPSIAATTDSLRVFFVSDRRDAADPTNEIYCASVHVDSMTWSPARKLSINSDTEHDHLPFAAWTGNELTLVWVRHDTSQPAPWLDPPPTSHVYFATSADGATWSAASAVTTDAGPAINVFPSLYRRQGGSWRLLWLSSRTGPPAVFELSVATLGAYPTGVVANTALPQGYSHRVTRTPTSGVYFGAWVQGPEGFQEIYGRFYDD